MHDAAAVPAHQFLTVNTREGDPGIAVSFDAAGRPVEERDFGKEIPFEPLCCLSPAPEVLGELLCGGTMN